MKKLEKSVPVIRFKGFSEAWEQRKLGDITESFSGGTPQAGNSDYYGGEIPFIRSGEINDEQTELFITDEGLNNSSAKIVEKGDILYALYGATSGEVGISQINGAINQAILAIRPTKDNNSYLIVQWLLKQKEAIIRTYLQGGQGNLSSSIVKELTLMLPKDKTEQAKIGVFFKQLDNTITLHQRKLEALKLMKKGLLQQMFPNNDKEIPNVRFTDFDGMWEQRKLKSITEKITRKNKELESTLPLTISAQDGLIDQNEYFNKIVASRNIRGYFLVKNGEFAYNKSYSKGYPWGVVKRLDNYNMGVLSTLYIIFKPVKINSDFLTKYFDSTYWYRAVSQFATEGARNHGLLNIAASDFFEIELNIPLNNEEQKKIGLFFQQLENILILHQNKLEKLSILKKTYLKKMFI
ncbi:TPA: restriction endonuclease subunit S [Listeria innocua]